MNCTAKKDVTGLFSGTKLESQKNALEGEDGEVSIRERIVAVL